MDFRSTAFWLFWLTFVSMHHNQFNTDRCFGAALHSDKDLQHSSSSSSSAPGNAKRDSDINDQIIDKKMSTNSLADSTQVDPVAHLFDVDFDGMEFSPAQGIQQSATINSVALAEDKGNVAISSGTSAIKGGKSRSNRQQTFVKLFKSSHKINQSPDNFTEHFKESIAKLLAAHPHLTTIQYAGPIHAATEMPYSNVEHDEHSAVERTSSTESVNSSRPHPPERRHIGGGATPEKLQYTGEINIKQGRLMGIIRQFHGTTGLRSVDQYLGLPYAEAPVGSRRFMPPGAPLPWMGLKIARHLPPVCPQKLPDLNDMAARQQQHPQTARPLRMSRGRYKHLTRLLPYLKNESEDCLYLNLYVPRDDGLGQPSLYPVLVYIHGESFEWNSGNPYDGSVLASYGQTIVVTVNYRLGVMGFMKPSIDENTVANFGLLDQIAALHWIKENIETFGGDRESVTLMGHSTGAACINYLMISPVASGLFHRAILMSGSAMSDWAASNHSLQLTMQIAHGLNCPLNDDNEQMLSCLRQKRYQDILKIPTSFPQFSTSLGPIVDGHVIPNQPYVVMGQYTEHFSRYDLLFGITESESYHALGALALEEGLRENERDNLLRFYMQSRFDVRPDLALAATLKKYNDMYNNPIKATNFEHRDVVLDILSDARVVGPLMQTGLFHADVNRHNYMYVFGHNSAAGPHASLPHSIAGEELAFVFGAPLAPSGPFSNNYSAQEKLLAEAVMAYWTNFAKTGNPKAPWQGNFINLHALEWDRYDLDWPEFNKRSQAYINIGIPPSIGYKYRQIYMNFWNKELPDELNQIAAMQRQPFVPSSHYPTGHWNEFGTRDNGAEDPVRTLKLLLQEPYATGSGKYGETSGADNMYNAPPTFGVAKNSDDDDDDGYGLNTLSTNIMAAGGVSGGGTEPIIYGVRRSDVPGLSDTGTEAHDEVDAGDTRGHDEAHEVAKSETTIQLLIGLIVVFIVLNVVIYSTFLLQKKKKSSTLAMQRKLGGILSYDGATDDELKRSKQTTIADGDESYVLDVVRKSNTYEAVKTERSPINGFKITRQLSSSTVDTHTKVCAWMSGAGNRTQALEGTLQRMQQQHQTDHSNKSKRSSSPTFSSLPGSSGAGGSFKQQPHKVNVSVDATPQGRGASVLGQEPIELSKGRQLIICQDVQVEDQELLTPQDSLDASKYSLVRQNSAATEPCDAELKPMHQHSRSDPVDMYYPHNHQMRTDEKVTSFMDINVTSRSDAGDDDDDTEPLTAEQQLMRMQQRNYPKVLPASQTFGQDTLPMTSDLSNTYKRNSLPPNSFLPIFGAKHLPPMPPPRTISTLGRRPSPSGRRNSTNITTSPLMLAADCTLEEDEPEITQNTLIVGPIVPKQTEGLYSTLKRRDITPQTPPITPTVGLSGSFQSFECSRPGEVIANAPSNAAHHTEKVYAIDATPTGTAVDTTPVVYAQSSKVTNRAMANKTAIPRIAASTATSIPSITTPATTMASQQPSRIPQPTPRHDTTPQTAKDRSSTISGGSSTTSSSCSSASSASVTTSSGGSSSSCSSSSSSSTGTVRTELQPQRPKQV